MTRRQQLRGAVRHATLRARQIVSDGLFERRQGIETGGHVDLEDLGLAGTDRIRYEPSGWLDLRRILRRGDVGPGDVFIDLGSGKGRVVLQAARYPFGRVIGVELSHELTRMARANLEATRQRLRCRDVELVTADMTQYAIPDDVTVAYLYNPVRGESFQAVVDQLIASVDRRPRTVRVIYRTPLEHGRLDATGRFRLMRVARGLRPSRHWAWYRSVRLYALEPAHAALSPALGQG
jgi:SAM-dependent methyltransferase